MQSVSSDSTFGRGYTIIELVVVFLLLGILAGVAFQGLLKGVDLYVTGTRDYLELFQEAKIAMEKMVRELRETNIGDVTVGSGTIQFTKADGHTTPLDGSLEITFSQVGNSIKRNSWNGVTGTDFTLVDKVKMASFLPGKEDVTEDGEDDIVTLEFTVSGQNSEIYLRTAVHPRQ